MARACAVLEEQRHRLAFWTISLSTAQLDWIERYASWPDFQAAIRHRLSRKLKAKGLRPLVIGVVEISPQRSKREGRLCPHLHVVFVGRQHRYAPWALSTADLDLVIVQALVAAQCFDLDVKSCGNVQPVRKSVGAYLSHYLKKAEARPGVCGRGFDLCPRHWFMQSRALLKAVRAVTVRLPLPFVAWCHQRAEQLVAAGMADHQRIEIPDARAPAVWSFLWSSVEAVAAALADWQEQVWDADWMLNASLSHDRT